MSKATKYEISFSLNTHFTKLDELDKARTIVVAHFKNCSLVQQEGFCKGNYEISYLLTIVLNITREDIWKELVKFAKYVKDHYHQSCLLLIISDVGATYL